MMPRPSLRDLEDARRLDDEQRTRQRGPALSTRQDAEQYVRGCLGEHADAHDVPAIADELHEHAGRSWDVSRVDPERFWSVVQAHALEGGDVPELPDLDSPAAVVREIAWVAREARELVGSDDEQRRAAYLARKAALFDHLTSDDDDFSAGYRAGHRAGVREGRSGS